jgi:hypothetical protein
MRSNRRKIPFWQQSHTQEIQRFSLETLRAFCGERKEKRQPIGLPLWSITTQEVRRLSARF